MHYVPHLIGQSDSTHTTGILGTVPLAKHGVLLLPLLSAHISCSLCIDIGLFAISFLLIASSALIYNPCISLLSRPHLPQRGTAYIPLPGYAPGLVRLSGGLYVIRCAVSHQKSIFLSSALDDTNGILALMVSSCLVPPPASCGEERRMWPSRLIVTPRRAVFSGIARF